MNPVQWSRRDERVAQLVTQPELTPEEQAELDRLEAARTTLWRELPRRIRRARSRLDRLTAYADTIGLGPC